jgi:hypothetical protein
VSDLFPNSCVRNDQGDLTIVYRGDFRPIDFAKGFRVYDFEDGGGSGGLYFTEDASVASSYSTSKGYFEDNASEVQHHLWLTGRAGRRVRLLDFNRQLTAKNVEVIKARILTYNGSAYQGGEPVISKPTLEEYLVRSRRNVVLMTVNLLVESGVMSVPEFIQFWKDVGVAQKVDYEDPYEARSTVTPVYLDIRQPLDLRACPADLLSRLEARAGRHDETLLALKDIRDTQSEDTLSFITRPFREALFTEGYDGICDMGGAITGGVRHRVWIAFAPEQITSAFNEISVRYRRDRGGDMVRAFSR